MKASVYRLAHFNAAHRLHNPNWSDEKNKAVFGVCNNEHYHGHNYDLEVRLTGEIDPDTGYVYDMKALADLIEEFVEKRFDHKNLNVDVPDFQNLRPSAENIAMVIYNILREKIDPNLGIRVKLWETPRNYVSFPVKE
ncbi:MAG: 6-carboxytetrahydropterin synthase [Saprospiraceae bacterium]|nr:6-carboxytetrahydropterin synthase [Saprospiraceae bacterium]MCB9309813.1 6-carboxytetrahydropterin synthase [Lewinellaceae bacterium]